MELVRLIYLSENRIDEAAGGMLAQVTEILRVANARNEQVGLTGALIFDRTWFVQALEGDMANVWETYGRIVRDPRHANVTFVEMRAVESRRFGNWWMGCCERNPHSAEIFEPYLHEGKFHPNHMSTDAILSLMTDLARMGYERRLAS